MGCDDFNIENVNISQISTHTSRVGCDGSTDRCIVCGKISTHTSRVGCDGSIGISMSLSCEFLLIHPVWDVTSDKCILDSDITFLLTHPVWDVTSYKLSYSTCVC